MTRDEANPERYYVNRMYDTIIELMTLADSIHLYGKDFPGEPKDDPAMKNAQALLDEVDAYNSARRKENTDDSG